MLIKCIILIKNNHDIKDKLDNLSDKYYITK